MPFLSVQASREADLSLRRKVIALKKNPTPSTLKTLNQGVGFWDSGEEVLSIGGDDFVVSGHWPVFRIQAQTLNP